MDTDGVVKSLDQYSVTLTCRNEDGSPADLTGATLVLRSRARFPSNQPKIDLTVDPGPGAGQVTYTFDGTLEPNTYEWEVVATWASPARMITFPTSQSEEPQFVVVRVI